MKSVSVRNTAIALIASVGLMAPAIYADMHGKGMMGGQKGCMMADQKGGKMQMSDVMHDMSETMKSMSREMGMGGMSAGQQKQMGERMVDMSKMMDDMSGMMGKGMMEADQQKKMNEICKQMDMMKKK